MKLVRGHNNGPPVLGRTALASGPTVNGLPVGGPAGSSRSILPPREAHVLNDAILRAALDLSKRERTRRKVIFVISDGRELGSKASYSDVLRVLETRDIQVRAVVVDRGALPVYRQLEKAPPEGTGLQQYPSQVLLGDGGGQVFSELSRNAIEDAYAQITSEARNQYTLGYVPKAVAEMRLTLARNRGPGRQERAEDLHQGWVLPDPIGPLTLRQTIHWFASQASPDSRGSPE